ncbi:MAG: hypothetical protein HC861_09050 [Rhodospirillaceae bacterium]|nr:hypothetical protein [Rhodospirillaceae bacterium]
MAPAGVEPHGAIARLPALGDDPLGERAPGTNIRFEVWWTVGNPLPNIVIERDHRWLTSQRPLAPSDLFDPARPGLPPWVVEPQ